MATLFIDYCTAVLAEYERKRQDGSLSSQLEMPSPANLKDACILALTSKLSRKDESILRSFFGNLPEGGSYERLVDETKVDRFKPIGNFIRRQTKLTDSKNVNLLAWLLDFEPRPFNRDLHLDEDTGLMVQPKELAAHLPIARKSPRNKFRSLLIIIPAAVAMGFTLNWWVNRSAPAASGFLAGSCMYWNGKQYELVGCDQKKYDTLIIAADSFQLRHQQLVMQPDTITLRSARKLWCVVNDGRVEVFTVPGNYPPDPSRKLQVLTAHKIQKYILLSRKE